MAFQGPNTQFKITSSRFRRKLKALGMTAIQAYNRARSFKLQKHLYTMTVTALGTATTVGSQYTSPNGRILTVQVTAPVGATTLLMSSEIGSPDAAPSTLTYVANSSGTLGTHQASISYSAFITTPPADLGSYQIHE